MRSDNLQLPCVQPPTFMCTTSFLTYLHIYLHLSSIHHGRDGHHLQDSHHNRDGEDARDGHHGCHGHGHQALHVDHSHQSHHG